MRKLVLTLIVLVGAGAAAVRYFPEKVVPFLDGTPLEEYVEMSKPVYQWRDAKGQWQVTDEPPRDGVPFEIKRYALDANLLPSNAPGKD